MAAKFASVDDYLASCNADVRPVMDKLRKFILDTLPSGTEEVKYGVAVFRNAKGAPVLYLNSTKDHVNFGLLRGAELTDPKSVLRGTGKSGRHIRILPGEPIDKDMLAGFIHQCSALEP